MKNEINFDRSSNAFQAHMEYNGFDEIPAGDPIVKKASILPVAQAPNEQIGIPTPIIPEK
jgi:hypothetical protein